MQAQGDAICLMADIFRTPAPRVLTHAPWEHHDFGAYGRAVVEVNDVLVDHSNATRGNALADGPGLVRAVNPVKGVLVALPEIQCAGAERVVRAAAHSHAAPQLGHC